MWRSLSSVVVALNSYPERSVDNELGGLGRLLDHLLLDIGVTVGRDAQGSVCDPLHICCVDMTGALGSRLQR